MNYMECREAQSGIQEKLYELTVCMNHTVSVNLHHVCMTYMDWRLQRESLVVCRDDMRRANLIEINRQCVIHTHRQLMHSI